MKTILHTIALVLISATLKAQGSTEVVYNINGTFNDVERVEGIETDFLYSCGAISENGISFGVINKADVSGNLFWSKRIDSPDNTTLQELEISSNGDLLAVGVRGYGEGEEAETILLRLDPDGGVVFAKSIDFTNDYYFSQGIQEKENGNILLHCAVGDNQAFIGIIELDADGNVLESRKFGSENQLFANSMTLDENGNILFVGSQQNPTYFLPDGVLIKLNADFEIIWSKKMSQDVSPSETNLFLISIDCAKAGSNFTVLFETLRNDLTEADSQNKDVLAMRIDDSGNIESEIILDLGYLETAHDLEVSESGKVFITGGILPNPVSEGVKSFVIELDSALALAETNIYSTVFGDILLKNSTVLSDASNYVASVGSRYSNSAGLGGYLTMNTIGADACAATAGEGVSYDPEFILEDIELESLPLEADASELVIEFSDADNGVSVLCSETLSNNSLKPEMDIEIYPNPCSDYFKIEGLSEPSLIRVRDILGRTVLETSYLSGRINAGEWPGGMYLIDVNGNQTFRIVKN